MQASHIYRRSPAEEYEFERVSRIYWISTKFSAKAEDNYDPSHEFEKLFGTNSHLGCECARGLYIYIGVAYASQF